MILGEIIKEFRTTHKMSMEVFAKNSGLTKGYISMLEKNEHPKTKKPIIPTEETLTKVAKGMMVDIDTILEKLDPEQEIQINVSPNKLSSNNITTETNQGLVMGYGDNDGDVTINNAKDEHDSCRQQEMADNSAEDIDLQKEILVHIDAQTEIQQKILDTQKKILKEVKRLSTSPEAQNEPLSDFNEIHEELYSYHVYERLSAGIGSAVWDGGSFDTAYFDKELPHDIASWVYGDSMEPTFLDGEVALIRANGYDYDGAVYAVVWDGRTYIKRVYKEEDGLRLESLNPKYRDLFAPFEEEPRVVGLVVGHFMPMEK